MFYLYIYIVHTYIYKYIIHIYMIDTYFSLLFLSICIFFTLKLRQIGLILKSIYIYTHSKPHETISFTPRPPVSSKEKSAAAHAKQSMSHAGSSEDFPERWGFPGGSAEPRGFIKKPFFWSTTVFFFILPGGIWFLRIFDAFYLHIPGTENETKATPAYYWKCWDPRSLQIPVRGEPPRTTVGGQHCASRPAEPASCMHCAMISHFFVTYMDNIISLSHLRGQIFALKIDAFWFATPMTYVLKSKDAYLVMVRSTGSDSRRSWRQASISPRMMMEIRFHLSKLIHRSPPGASWLIYIYFHSIHYALHRRLRYEPFSSISFWN